jgi:lipid-A-disaccharide synthase
MHVFVSAGEPSGDLHGANLVHALRRLDPGVRCVGFGGERMEAAGCRLLYPLCRLAVMWFLDVFANIRQFFRLKRQARDYFRAERPDALVVIDYPGFHWHVMKAARDEGIPVYYFVPPQIWAWAPWRVGKMRRRASRVLCALPFETGWYQARGVAAEYVGHPYFDELAEQPIDPDFLHAERLRAGTVVGLLPGSRMKEVRRNFVVMAKAAARIHAARPGVRFLVASFNREQEAIARDLLRASGLSDLPIDFHVGRTPEIIELAATCVAVSGSVSLELMYRLKPAVVLYKLDHWHAVRIGRAFMRVPYISLVNLLAGEEVFPEHLTHRDVSAAIAERALEWLADPAAAEAVRTKLRRIRDQVAVPGACERAAMFILEQARQGGQGKQAA